MIAQSRLVVRSNARWLYAAVVAVALLSGMWAALSSVSRQHQVLASPHVPVLCFALLTAAGLFLMRPSAAPYALGLLCLLGAIVAYWLASPNGGTWANLILRDPDFNLRGGGVFGYLFLVLFPAGWILLCSTVGSFARGAISYLAAGLAFLLMHLLLLGQVPAALVPVYVLFWPHFTLTMMGVFGRKAVGG